MSYSRKSCRTFLETAQYNRVNYSATNDPDRNNLWCSGNPDLSIGNPSYNALSGMAFGTPPPVSISGVTVSYSVDVENAASGSGCIPSELGYYLSSNSTITTADYLLGDDAVNALAPGSSQTVTASFDLSSASFSSIPSGTYYIGAYADYSNIVNNELSGTNNIAAFEWTNGLMLPGSSPVYSYYQITLVRGCMDPLALNYDSTANVPGSSCIYPIMCCNTSAYGSATADLNAVVTISSCNYLSEYSTISGVGAGESYTASLANNSTGSTTVILLYTKEDLTQTL